jgi:hypothetical protein
MPPEREHPLSLAATRKRTRTLERALSALGELDSGGEPISFQAVARRAGVSRQWLYDQPELRAEIERLRRRPPTPAPGPPAREQGSTASPRQRIEALLEENRRLRAENAELREELALAYGRERAGHHVG